MREGSPQTQNGRPLEIATEIIMEEFYKVRTNDPNANDKTILDNRRWYYYN